MLLSSEETQLGKRKVLNEAHLKELVLPEQGELLGRVQKISGGNQVLVQCTDGEIRLCRIRGKMKRRMWIREGDIVLISPWDFDHKRADIVWRYIKDHADWRQRFADKLRHLPDEERQHSSLTILGHFAHPHRAHPEPLKFDNFIAAVRNIPAGPDVPHLSEVFIHKYLDDMRRLGLLSEAARMVA